MAGDRIAKKPIIAWRQAGFLASPLTFNTANDKRRINTTKAESVAQYMLSDVLLMSRRDEGQILHIIIAVLKIDGGRKLLRIDCQYSKNTLNAPCCA